jgi:hypothetical protein
MTITKNVGMFCLSIYLIIGGLAQFIPELASHGVVASLFGLLAGVFILINK